MMTKKEGQKLARLQDGYDSLMQQKQEMLGYFGEIRRIIDPSDKHDGISPYSVVEKVKRLYKIGSIKPFTEEQLEEYRGDLEREFLKDISL